jgi:hypothetical protein
VKHTPATTQNFVKQNQTFTFSKEERKVKVTKEGSQLKHTSLITLKNVKGDATSQERQEPKQMLIQQSN